MDCPGCHAQVADGTAICPHCDHIIDDSFLAGTGVEEAEPELEATTEPTPVGPAPRRSPRESRDDATVRKRAPIRSQVRVEPVRSRAPARRAPAPQPEAEAEPHTDPVQEVNVPAPRPRAYAAASSDDELGFDAPEKVLGEIRTFFGQLSFTNRLSFAGSALLLFSCFLPWKDTRAEDEVLGFLSLGFACFLGAIVALAALVVRVRGTAMKINPLVPWFAQLGALLFCSGWELFYIRTAWDGRRMLAIAGNYERMVSYPTYGVFLALTCTLVALAGTLMGLRERTG